jgi:hypothetical protein
MIKTIKHLVNTCNLFKKHFNWSDERTERAMMHELFLELLKYYKADVEKEYTKKSSRRIDCLQQILDDWE